jgi:hypothetical protein
VKRWLQAGSLSFRAKLYQQINTRPLLRPVLRYYASGLPGVKLSRLPTIWIWSKCKTHENWSTLYLLPPLLPREKTHPALPFSQRVPTDLPKLTRGSAPPVRVTRLPVGFLALRPATLPFGNLPSLIAQTPLWRATGVYGQLPGLDLTCKINGCCCVLSNLD